MSWYSFRPYVPVGERRAKALLELAKLAKKTGKASSPVVLGTRKIAGTFWGKAWCDNLEVYSDFANRLPRGRSYVRNGSVVDLQISRGKVTALVSGSSLYKIDIKIKPLAASLWKSIQTDCAGKIDSLIELLQGKLSSSVMQIVTRPEQGLFPTPREIELDCSCPDWADLCKHVAASLYGVGARLDRSPELLFLLRGVDPADLISKASAADTVRQSARAEGAAAMSEAEIADVFGIELADTPTPVQSTRKSHESVDAKNQTPIPASIQEPKTKPPKKASRRISSSARAKIAASARARWEKIKAAADRDKPSVRKMSVAAKAKIVAAQKARGARHETTSGK
jgi:uncharacterized Zn finger protein